MGLNNMEVIKMEMSFQTWILSLGIAYFMGLVTSKKTKGKFVVWAVCISILYIIYRILINV